jgi:hypothetical protein
MIYLFPDEICGAARERKGRIHHRDGEDGRKTARKHLHLSSRRLSVSVVSPAFLFVTEHMDSPAEAAYQSGGSK